MSRLHGNVFSYICIACHRERVVTTQDNPSGLCRACYHAHRLYFSPGALFADETIDNFWRRVDKDKACACHEWEERCWIWTGQVNKRAGYGAFAYRDHDKIPHSISAHRFAYQLTHGSIAREIQVLHIPPCITRLCIRHLYAGTHNDNMHDRQQMGRYPSGEEHAQIHHNYKNHLRGEAHAQARHGYSTMLRGEQHPSATFTEEEIRAIRVAYDGGIKIAVIAKQYNRNIDTISLIVHRKTWKHIP